VVLKQKTARRIASSYIGWDTQHIARALGIESGLVLAAAIVAAATDVRPSTFAGDASSPCSRWPWACATPPSGGSAFPT
jgi:hypothetical protein